MNSRQRVESVLEGKVPDRIPADLGGTSVTGMHVSSVYLIRQALRLDSPGTPVKVVDPFQMLGEIEDDLRDALGIDTVPLWGKGTLFGFPNDGWKEWRTFDGTPVLVPGLFNTAPEPNGDILLYPQGDRSAPPSGRMPKGGFYFDAIVRQKPFSEEELKVADNLEEYQPISDETIEWFRCEAERLYRYTDKALFGQFTAETSFGDIAQIPAPMLKWPKGIRDPQELLISFATRREYLHEAFSRMTEVAIHNLSRLHEAVGDRVAAVFLSGADFGTQMSPLISCETYRELLLPYQKKVNDWLHTHTKWKSMIHTCGAVAPLIDFIIEAGYDILNPLQFSAAGMDAVGIKMRHGKHLVFLGGAVDTQKTLPFGTPDEVREEVRNRLRILGEDGGYIFNAIHNIQAGVPVENLLAFFEAYLENRKYC